MHLINFFHKIYRRFSRGFLKLFGASSVGVRAIVVNSQQQLLLVKHTYTTHWYFPGGGIKKNETTNQAISRELDEETGVVANKLKLFNVYLHNFYDAPDYIVLYEVKNFSITEKKPCLEIAEIGWFDYEHLPHDISPATKRRIDEYFGKSDKKEFW